MNLAQRKRWSLVLLLVWLPIYLIAAWWLLAFISDQFGGRPPMWLELPLYVILAFAWAIPFRRVFGGIGRAEDGGAE